MMGPTPVIILLIRANICTKLVMLMILTCNPLSQKSIGLLVLSDNESHFFNFCIPNLPAPTTLISNLEHLAQKKLNQMIII